MDDVTALAAMVMAGFFAMNIGASGTAASMGVPYGGGAIQNRRLALWLVAACALVGATIGGHAVVATIGEGLVETSAMTAGLVLVILGSACITLFSANLLGIPLSTSEVTVGAVVGVGLALDGIHLDKLFLVISSWVALPVVAFAVVVTGRKHIISHVEMRLAARRNKRMTRKLICALCVLSGCYEAFSAGMNNVANAIGPLQSAGLIDLRIALPLGGLGLGIGAVVLGGRVLETNAKKITRLSLLDATLVSLTGGTLVVLASLAGIPVPLTQTTTVAIMGIGWAKRGADGVNRTTVTQIFRVWLLSPLASLFLSLGAASAVLGTSSWLDVGIAAGWISASLALLFVQSQSAVPGTHAEPASR